MDLNQATRAQAYSEAAGLTARPALVSADPQPSGSSSSHGEARLLDPRTKHRTVVRGDSANGDAKETPYQPWILFGTESESDKHTLLSAHAVLEAAVATQSLEFDPYMKVKLPSQETVLRKIAANLKLTALKDFGTVLFFLPGETTHHYAGRSKEARLFTFSAATPTILNESREHSRQQGSKARLARKFWLIADII